MLKLLIIEEHLFLRTWASSCNFIYNAEALVQRCSVKKVFLEILRNSQKSTCEFVKFLRTPFYTQQLWWLLLTIHEKDTAYEA